MLRKIALPVILLSFTTTIVSAAGTGKIVALDCFHNNENSPHYTWQQTSVGGYSQLAQLIIDLGADTASITTAMDSPTLAPVDVLIISDPDTPSESSDPQYVSVEEADAIDQWVQNGGCLMLLGNNAGNAEFTNFNVLAAKFGIQFNENTQSGSSDLTPLPEHPFFDGCTTLHIVGMCNLTITEPAEAVHTIDTDVIMAICEHGEGRVFALGDPWVYNEYINSQDNKACVTNVLNWIFEDATAISPDRLSRIQSIHSSPVCPAVYLPNGRLISRDFSNPSAMSRINNHGMIYIIGTPSNGQTRLFIKK